MTTTRLAALAAAASLAACGADGADPAGDELPEWVVGPEAIRIGSIDDPEHAFGLVRALAVDSEGRI